MHDAAFPEDWPCKLLYIEFVLRFERSFSKPWVPVGVLTRGQQVICCGDIRGPYLRKINLGMLQHAGLSPITRALAAWQHQQKLNLKT